MRESILISLAVLCFTFGAIANERCENEIIASLKQVESQAGGIEVQELSQTEALKALGEIAIFSRPSARRAALEESISNGIVVSSLVRYSKIINNQIVRTISVLDIRSDNCTSGSAHKLAEQNTPL